MILVKVYPYDTIADLKASVQEKEGVPVDQQRLTFNGVHLEEIKLLSEYGILPECTLHLTTRMYSQFQIIIKTGRYSSTVIEVESCDTIATLKSRIQDKMQLPSKDFVLSFGEESASFPGLHHFQLQEARDECLEDDNESVQHCGIKSTSTLCLHYQHTDDYYTTGSGERIQVEYHWKQDRKTLSDSLYILSMLSLHAPPFKCLYL